MNLFDLRKAYHRRICKEIVRVVKDSKRDFEYPNFADVGNAASVALAWSIVKQLGYQTQTEVIKGQTSGGRFEEITKDFLEQAFALLHHLRPGEWRYTTQSAISSFDQYAHLAILEDIIHMNSELASALGKDYIVKPDIVVGRLPVTDTEINQQGQVLNQADPIAKYTSFRQTNSTQQILHASISCKWTLRSDRGQNARTEALNLMRNRKGHAPHIVAVTGEPLPTRIASLALGTGDLDCVYHFALHELTEALKEISNPDQQDMLSTLVSGRRLRDISDLPFDLAI